MKQMNVLVSVILVAAVLIAAYAVGLLVRQARKPEPPTQSQEVSEPNGTLEVEKPLAENLPKTRPGQTESSEEERARIKAEHAAQIADANKMTEEAKAQRRDEMRDRLLQQTTALPVKEMTAKEKAWVREHWSELSNEQRDLLTKYIQKIKALQKTTPDANAASQEKSGSEEGAESGASDPNTTTIR